MGGRRSMRLLIISVAKACYWVQCQQLKALDLLHWLWQPHITMYIPSVFITDRKCAFLELEAINFILLEMSKESYCYFCDFTQ